MVKPGKSDWQSSNDGILKRALLHWETAEGVAQQADFKSGDVLYISNTNCKYFSNVLLSDSGIYAVAGFHYKHGALSAALTIILIPIEEAPGSVLCPAPGHKVITCGLEVTLI
jgi:hypothetical protein